MIALETFRIKSMWGNYNFDFACSMACGRSGGLISMWDPNSFIKDDILCDDAFIIVKGHWRNTVGDCYMINIYGPQDSLAKAILWNRITDFMHQHADNSGLIDLTLGGRLFTWMNKAGMKLSKLDRFLISEEVVEALPDVRVTAIDRFYLNWRNITLEGSSYLMKNFASSTTRIMQWHSETKTSDRVTKHDNLQLIMSIEEKIKAGSANDEDSDSRIKLLQKVDILDTFESVDLFQKACVKWDIEGDENSNFFHRLKSSKTMIRMWISLRLLTLLDYVLMTVIAWRLLFSLDEVKNAGWDCGSSKAPGPDGFSFAFVKKFWDDFKVDILKYVNIFLDTGSLPHGSNSSFFTLIPKVDFEKAFDSVSWKYLDFVLLKLGFGSKWRPWIRACLCSSRALVLVNGSLTSEFSIKHGLRQGDPLSPFIFILVMEGLHNALSTVVFYLASGLKINIQKSNVYGIGVSDVNVSSMASNSGCASGSFHFTYLRLPIGSNMSLTSSWRVLLDSLNIGSLKAFNLALLQKWHLRLLSRKNVLWVKVIKALHGQEGGFDNNGCIYNGTWVRIISSSNFLHSNNIIPNSFFLFQAGCSTRIRFCKDTWVGDSPFYIRYNRLYRLEREKDYLIIDRIDHVQWRWNWSRPILGAQDSADLLDMLFEISSAEINEVEDTCVWSLGTDGTFSIKDARCIINSNILLSLAPSTVWDKNIPRKVNIFIWRLILDRLPHKLNLSSRVIDIQAIFCPSCNGNVESSNHIFLSVILPLTFGCLFVNGVIFSTSFAFIWWLWRYRNSVTFRSHPMRKSDIFDNIRFSS
ncbi:RNA-directed DNA polymerase, eukaryota, reverse transcriptase zinc-binding domain protein [Tanacetum coccineum]